MKAAAAQLRESVVESEVTGGAVRVPPDCQATFEQIAESCIDAILANKAPAARGNPDAIHAMRIALTRLRAARLFFSPAVDDAAWRRIDRQLRRLNSILGKARNRDVAIYYARRKRYRAWVGHSRRKLVRSRDKAHRQLAKSFGSARYSHLFSALSHWITGRPLPHNGQARRFDRTDVYCDDHLREWRNEISREGRHVCSLRRKRLHQLRIQSKNYRYMVTALMQCDIPLSREDFLFCEPARRVHQILGDLRDLKQLRKAVGRRPPRYRGQKRKLIKRVEKTFRRYPT